MDTREKRASVLGLALASLVVLPVPDSTVGPTDRAQLTGSYVGITAGDGGLTLHAAEWRTRTVVEGPG